MQTTQTIGTPLPSLRDIATRSSRPNAKKNARAKRTHYSQQNKGPDQTSEPTRAPFEPIKTPLFGHIPSQRSHSERKFHPTEFRSVITSGHFAFSPDPHPSPTPNKIKMHPKNTINFNKTKENPQIPNPPKPITPPPSAHPIAPFTAPVSIPKPSPTPPPHPLHWSYRDLLH
jgi:hypothetical protein